MTHASLNGLNPEQRRAVEHGISTPKDDCPPLLIIAGADSGKTNTLAHRVAQVILNGTDPRRILLMTFSRRASVEMGRRMERICTQVLGHKPGLTTDASAWAGTFHAIGAGLLREYANHIGL
jgi:DNA helicase-2/ATP-dependent DNA helicase PcrA